MKKNAFNPVRYESETLAQYHKRLADGKSQAQAITLTGWAKPNGECSRKLLRDSQRRSGAMKKLAGHYSRGLHNNITRKQAALLVN